MYPKEDQIGNVSLTFLAVKEEQFLHLDPDYSAA
jgi:hypothetical protein